MVNSWVLIGLGGAVGSLLRYGASQLIGPKAFPWATLGVNGLGSFAIGAVLAIGLKNEGFATHWKPFLATGLCGGFTTFSAFSAENMQLLQQGRYWLCFCYSLASIALGIGAAFLGYKICN
jgi:fluoride exporter